MVKEESERSSDDPGSVFHFNLQISNPKTVLDGLSLRENKASSNVRGLWNWFGFKILSNGTKDCHKHAMYYRNTNHKNIRRKLRKINYEC